MKSSISKPLISAADLDKVRSSENITLIDARSGSDAYERYASSHLEGAQHVDLDKDLSQKTQDPAIGGRHPLPDPHNFGILLGNLGITPTSHVIIYDDKGGVNAASRFWWMLQAAGHKHVQVLDGGLNAAIKQGIPVTTKIPKPQKSAPYPVKDWNASTVSATEVEKVNSKADHLIIDVREPARYLGENEPIDLIAGHIPGAINVYYGQNLDKDNHFLSSEELAEKYNAVIENRAPENVIVHCGSGVTACHTLLAMAQAGITGPKLYVGSWSEWSSSGRPVIIEA